MAVQAVGEDLDPDSIVRRTVDLACAVTGAEHAIFAINDAAGDIEAMVTHGDPAGAGGGLALPLRIGGEVTGTLHLGGREEPFDGRDTQVLSVLLSAASSALTHAQVQRRMVRDLQRAELNARHAAEEAAHEAPLEELRRVVGEASGRLGFRPTLRLTEEGAPLPAELLGELVPVVTAALDNVAAHAKAASVRVEVDVSPAWMMLAVADDGVGVDPTLDHGDRDGRGLAAMRSSADRLGGVFRIASGIDQEVGTRISWIVPVSAARSGAADAAARARSSARHLA
ncbi:MAG: hypothetical protein J2O46_07495 [Nocardioides sp.]|nr:hypothetical protein [Nocardioides sp.]